MSSVSITEGRRVFLDAFRTIAAYGVAIAHYWAFRENQGGEFWAAFFVELFFPLSGFVLAPQVLRVSAGIGNLPVFYFRRWFRTLPAYWIALSLAAILAGAWFSWDFWMYASFLQDVGRWKPSIPFYPVAWSLAVEEWFYLLFPLWMWACSRIRFRPITAALIFCAGIQAARLWAVAAGNADAIRTLTWLRLDAIAMGFILWNLRSYRPGRILGGVLLLIFGLGVGILATTSQLASLSVWQKWVFIQAAMACSVLILWGFICSEPLQPPAWLSWICEWGGRVSYPLYLFHLFFLPKAEKTIPNFCLYLVGLTVFCAAFHMIVEMPLLRRRPTYAANNQP
jgi:peptidoglycan/LPS O-acetylase OafA/YrhL